MIIYSLLSGSTPQRKQKKIGFQNMLMKPQFTFTNEFQTKFGIK